MQIISLLLIDNNGILEILWIVFFIVYVLCFLVVKLGDNLILENKYQGEFWVKTQSSDQLIKVTPDTPLPIKVTFIIINNVIYKFEGGQNLIITPSGKPSSYSILSTRYIRKIDLNKLKLKEKSH